MARPFFCGFDSKGTGHGFTLGSVIMFMRKKGRVGKTKASFSFFFLQLLYFIMEIEKLDPFVFTLALSLHSAALETKTKCQISPKCWLPLLLVH